MSSSLIKALINSTIKEETGIQPLTFTFTNPGTNSIKTYYQGSPNLSGLQYRFGTSGPWLPYDVNSTLTIENRFDSIQFQNTNDTLSIDTNNYFTFYITGSR